ncbi:hypothetical protein [Frondihabitans cladoniiphilus]|uniref:Transcriptional regulator n=1 Tax=Frondihabitans cladoniiphilus TaxID=715785 RepID=A0ABP8VUF2_9MICO
MSTSDDETGDARDGLVAHPTPPALRPRKRGRRVTTDPVPGSDPTPAPVDRRVDSSDNDSRLKQDVPPHWG